MARYSVERKESISKKLLPPHKVTVAEIARQEHISLKTLYNWRDTAKQQGMPVPGKTLSADDWTADAKLSVVIQTAALSASELGQYCREKGLYPEQVQRWKSECLQGFQTSEAQGSAVKHQAKKDKVEIKLLKKDLRFKEKALAETVALLVLRKKLNALWEDGGEES